MQEELAKLVEGKLEELRQEHEDGDKLALLDCIMWCDNYGCSLPEWALTELAQIAFKYLDGQVDNLHNAYLGAASGVGGRHSNPVTARRERAQRQLYLDVETALRERGYTGKKLYKKARDVLSIFEIKTGGTPKIHEKPRTRGVPGPETIRKGCQRAKKDRMQPSYWVTLIPLYLNWDIGKPVIKP